MAPVPLACVYTSNWKTSGHRQRTQGWAWNAATTSCTRPPWHPDPRHDPCGSHEDACGTHAGPMWEPLQRRCPSIHKHTRIPRIHRRNPLLKIPSRHSLTKQKPLHLRTPGRPQEIRLLHALHTLRQHVLVHPLAHGDDGADDGGAVVIPGDVADEGAVDLQGVDREVLEV